jgi:hypothetical protein
LTGNRERDFVQIREIEGERERERESEKREIYREGCDRRQKLAKAAKASNPGDVKENPLIKFPWQWEDPWDPPFLKCSHCRQEIMDTSGTGLYTCEICLEGCEFGLELSQHPCGHCGMVGQDFTHPDCRCSSGGMKYDCPCNPTAVAFPLVLHQHTGLTPRVWDDPKDWCPPYRRAGYCSKNYLEEWVTIRAANSARRKIADVALERRRGKADFEERKQLLTNGPSPVTRDLYEFAKFHERSYLSLPNAVLAPSFLRILIEG